MGEPLFRKVPSELDFPKEEREILRFWQREEIFEATLSKVAPNGRFVFFEGPPTANGLPHNGHVLTRVIKDLFPRYKTMRGWSVPRKAGWDTHGLPVEVEVERELRLHGRAAIEAYGVEPFVKKCIESVFRYTKEWEALTERVAFWVDLDDAYVTYHRSYVESEWWALSELFKKGLLYQGHKVVWWWAQGGTALSAGEVGQGYRTVDDPSVYVAFRVVGEENLSLLVWTTTPWTLPSNMYAAVHPELDYVVVKAQGGRRYVVAEGLLEVLSKKVGALEVEGESRRKGKELEGLRYAPPFDVFEAWNLPWTDGRTGKEIRLLWRVVLAPFVTLDAGTGVVHIAPAFGEDDHDVYKQQLARFSSPQGAAPLHLLNAVKPDGTFVREIDLPDGTTKTVLERYAGRWVKDCDNEIVHDLKDRDLLVHRETYRHEYPFCWRADSDPLIQYARPAWYIRTTALKERAQANNQAVQWFPEHIRDGRFGDFLANNVDWALSRERWWGTPLNLWVCVAGHLAAPSSVAEIERRNARAFDHFRAARRADPTLNEHLIVHKPWIDQVTFPCPECGGPMQRVPEVVDCWFDSGCMPFAQWGYPHASGSTERFEASFPADFISEAIDQTRGWFYSLLMISTLVFDRPFPHPFKTCIVLGHVSDKEGKKESKSKGNYTPPEIILDKVAMDFAVVADPAAEKGVALIGREDLGGLDLEEGARVRVYREDAPAEVRDLVVRVRKDLPRRLVALHVDDRAALGVLPAAPREITPSQVPRLPCEERVTVEDPSTPAPGADAFRWFFFAASPPWSATRHSLSNVRSLQKEFAVKLRNVYSFFTIYANIDGFDPRLVHRAKAGAERPEMDRWMASELALTVREVTAALDGYDVFGGAQKLVALVDALSNWWVRGSRARFWRSGWDDDKASAYETLHRCLVTLAKLTAPFTPYAAEGMWQNLVVEPARRAGADVERSVHLASWPAVDDADIDTGLSRKVQIVRDLVSLGLRARMDWKVKVRQPLRVATIVLNDERDGDLVRSALDMVRGELNVLEVVLGTSDDRAQFGTTRYKPNFRTLGQRGLGRLAQELKRAWAMPDASEREVIQAALKLGSAKRGDADILADDVEVSFEPKPGFAAAADRVGSVFLDTKLDDELRDLGLLREIQSRVQTMRKEMGLEYTDRIHLSVLGSERVGRVVEAYKDALALEVLAVDISTNHLFSGAQVREVDVEGDRVRLGITRA